MRIDGMADAGNMPQTEGRLASCCQGVGGEREPQIGAARGAPGADELPMNGAAGGLPSSMFSQYGPNLTANRDIFPIMAQVLGSITNPLPPQAMDDVITDSEHPPFSPSNLEGNTLVARRCWAQICCPRQNMTRRWTKTRTHGNQTPKKCGPRSEGARAMLTAHRWCEARRVLRWPPTWTSRTKTCQPKRVWWTPS
jgi:hypothetical protein